MLLEIFNKLNRPRAYLLLMNVLVVFFLIALSNLHILPIKYFSDFVFFAVIYLAFALYRPGWSFLFFVGAIALENINLAPPEIEIMIRPYQFVGALTILAVLIKLTVNRLGFKMPRWNWFDLLLIIFTIAGFISALGALDKNLALKQSVIIGSFVTLYFLVRVFIQSFDDLRKITPFFLSSSVVVILYGIWQNIRFAHNLTSFEVMPGRPNATFAEADWLGIYLVLLLAVIYTLIYFVNRKCDSSESVIFNFQFSIFNEFPISKFSIFKLFLYLLLTACYILLILTVSRSAWLGALAVTFVFLFSIWTNLKINPKNWEWKNTLRIKIPLIIALLLSFAVIYFFNLTSFQLFNRAQSIESGLQKITVSCENNFQNECLSVPIKDPLILNNVEDLEKYCCRHINLEDIEKESRLNRFITTVYRKDPNISIRSEIYQKSWEEIKQNPIMGIGWGSIGKILGADGRGSSLNSSNIFLEVWLGAGILGLLAFLFVLIYVFIKSVILIRGGENKTGIIGVFLLLGFMAIIVPNLFNAGIMLGFLWIFFAIANVKIEK